MRNKNGRQIRNFKGTGKLFRSKQVRIEFLTVLGLFYTHTGKNRSVRYKNGRQIRNFKVTEKLFRYKQVRIEFLTVLGSFYAQTDKNRKRPPKS